MDFAPWYVVPSDNKRQARLNCIAHLPSLVPCKGAYNDRVALEGRRCVPVKY